MRLSGSPLRHLVSSASRCANASPGEDRRPTLSWLRNIPIDGEPPDVAAVVNEYSKWLAGSDVRTHPRAGMIRRYIIWPDNHAHAERLRLIVGRANVA